MSLVKKTVSGLFWSGGERFLQVGIRFFIQIVLARILAPEQFGLVAMVAVFIAISNGVVDGGLGQAIVQRKELSTEDINTVFTCNMILGGVMAALLWLLAPLVADFYREAQLVSLLRALSLSVLIGSAGRIHSALITRSMEFRKSLFVSLPAALIAGVTAIVLALNGFGVWTLVVQALIGVSLQTTSLWIVSGWKPRLGFSIESFKSIFPYGSRIWTATIIAQVFDNIYVLFIGRMFMASDVGFYQRADSFRRLATENLTSITRRVTFPLFSRMQHDLVALRRGFLMAVELHAYLFFPLMALLAGVAGPFISVILGEKWLPSVPYLRLLCIVGALYPIHSLHVNILKSLGHASLLLRTNILKSFIRLVLLIVICRYGVLAMIVGQVVASLFSLYINGYCTRKVSDISYFTQLRCMIIPCLIAGLVASSSWWASGFDLAMSIYDLFLSLGIGATVGFMGLYLARGAFEPVIEILSVQYPKLKMLQQRLYGQVL
jgi:teichuronic acid exporter